MPIFEITEDAIRPLDRTTLREAELRERSDLQRLLRDEIEIVAPGTLVIAEEFGEWTDSRRRIDLLETAENVVSSPIEPRRTEGIGMASAGSGKEAGPTKQEDE